MKAKFNNELSSSFIRIKEVDQQYLDAPFHYHNSCEIVLIQKSSGKRIVGDHVDNFDEGDLVVMGPDLPHIWQNDMHHIRSSMSRVKAIVIYFSPAFLLELSQSVAESENTLRFMENISRGLTFRDAIREEAIGKLSGISSVSGLQKISLFMDVMHLLVTTCEFDFLATEQYKNSYKARDTKRFNDVYHFLINNFHREIALDEIAEISKMSPNAFCRYFKTKTHKSFTVFLNELRIGHSCNLLKQADYPIANIAFDCGFNNLVNFNKIFKKVTSKTPTEFRRSIPTASI